MKSLKKVMRLSKKEKYLLTCSFGPDSMALFYYLLKHGFTFEVAHVNYHILEQADDDERGIKEFAEKYNIKVHVLKTYMPKNVNEEIWAREVRYNYFEKVAKERNIKIGVHIILGLPGETKQEMKETVKMLADIGADGVKFHCLCIFPNTKLYEMYEQGQIKLLEEDEYVDIACDCLELLPERTTIHRLGGNGLQSIKVAPKWLNKKFEIL